MHLHAGNQNNRGIQSVHLKSLQKGLFRSVCGRHLEIFKTLVNIKGELIKDMNGR